MCPTCGRHPVRCDGGPDLRGLRYVCPVGHVWDESSYLIGTEVPTDKRPLPVGSFEPSPTPNEMIAAHVGLLAKLDERLTRVEQRLHWTEKKEEEAAQKNLVDFEQAVENLWRYIRPLARRLGVDIYLCTPYGAVERVCKALMKKANIRQTEGVEDE